MTSAGYTNQLTKTLLTLLLAAGVLSFCAAMSAPTDDKTPAAAASQPITGEVVLYCSVDDVVARPLLAEFERRTSIKVRAIYDTEAGKTTGLVERLRSEQRRPRADVFWSSEVFGTIELAELGVWAGYDAAAARDIPAQYRDAPRHRWTAFGLRGRVIAYDPKRTRAADVPRAWHMLSAPAYRDKLVMANPQFGTTRGHLSALRVAWGEAAFTRWLESLRQNRVKLADGNSHSVRVLAAGQAEFAMTDTDDVLAAQSRGESVQMVYPDVASADKPPSGAIWIPNSVALVKGGPNPSAAKALIEQLVSESMESALARSESGNVPVRSGLRARLKIADPAEARIDFVAASGAELRKCDRLTREILIRN